MISYTTILEEARPTHLNPMSVEAQECDEASHLKEEVDDEGQAGVEGESVNGGHVRQAAWRRNSEC